MKHQILVLQDAEDDIFDIYKYILDSDSRDRAQYVFEHLSERIASLGEMPDRGHLPPELERIGVTGFLEIHFKPYRIMYQIVDNRVFIHCVLDGRRALQDVLERRLLR